MRISSAVPLLNRILSDIAGTIGVVVLFGTVMAWNGLLVGLAS